MIVFDNTWTIAPRYILVHKDDPNANQMAGVIEKLGQNTNPYKVGDKVIWRGNAAIVCGSVTDVIISIDDIGAYKR